MYNVVLFWLVIFVVVYIFTKQKGEQNKCDIDREEEMKLKIPSRRDELSKILNDGLDVDQSKLELRRFKNRCFNCEATENLELDHHLPLSRGYPLKCEDIGSNTVVLCKACNRRKGDKLPEDFYSAEKLIKLEEMGIKTHLYYSPIRLIELENFMIGEKIRKIEKAIEENKKITFTYYDMSKILFLEEEIGLVPIKIYDRKNIGSHRIGRDWYLEDRCNKLYNIRWMFNIKKEL